MLDRFTDRARKVMSMAKEEAIALGSTKVGTEHLLLALAKEDTGIAGEALRELDITHDDVLGEMKGAAASGGEAASAEASATPDDAASGDAPADAASADDAASKPDTAKLAFTPAVIAVME